MLQAHLSATRALIFQQKIMKCLGSRYERSVGLKRASKKWKKFFGAYFKLSNLPFQDIFMHVSLTKKTLDQCLALVQSISAMWLLNLVEF